MRFKEFLLEEFGGKNKKIFEEHESELKTYVKKQLYDIRKAKAGETIDVSFNDVEPQRVKAKEGQYFLRSHDEIDKVKLIDEEDFQGTYEPIQSNEKEDAEGFKVYREIGYYEAFNYGGEDIYIFTDWNTKQRLKTGDFLVRDADDKNDSGFVVPAVEFERHFEESK